MTRLCESERNYRSLEHGGDLKKAVGAYSIGQRSSNVLRTLAYARVWSEHIGEWVPMPVGFDRSTWTDILDALVVGWLGNRRCLDCSLFFSDHNASESSNALQCSVGTGPNAVLAYQCPTCGSTTSETVGCTEGVV